MSQNFTNDDALNQVLGALRKDNFPDTTTTPPPAPVDAVLDGTEEPPAKPKPPLDMDSMDVEFKDLLTKIGESIKNNTEVLQEASNYVKMVGDDKSLEAYASVAKSNAELLKTFQSAVMEKQKLILTEKLKERDIEAKKEIAALKITDKNTPKLGNGGDTYVQNNFTLKASRDEMFKALFGNDEDKKKAVESIMTENNENVLEAEVVAIK